MGEDVRAESVAPSAEEAPRRMAEEGVAQPVTGPVQGSKPREGEIVIKEFVPPTSEEDRKIYPYRCSMFQNVPYLLVRGEDAIVINADSAKRIADLAKKTLAQYASCGIESSSAAYPVDPVTGGMADLHPASQEKNADGTVPRPAYIYERRFRINISLGVW